MTTICIKIPYQIWNPSDYKSWEIPAKTIKITPNIQSCKHGTKAAIEINLWPVLQNKTTLE